MSGAITQIVPGRLVLQYQAILARLALVFPATKFQTRMLPPKIDKSVWKTLTQGNQPFLGLGFKGFVNQKREASELAVFASWTLLVAVRASGTVETRYLGDTLSVGLLTLAPIAAALLHGWTINHAGTLLVTGMTHVAADEWTDDQAIMQIDFVVPMTLNFGSVMDVSDVGFFQTLAETWQVTPDGTLTATYTSEWDNPNAAP
jgi:hypothetical protein